MNIDLHIVLQTPPAGVDYGLQKGSGSKYETVQKQRSQGQDLYFDLSIELKGDRLKDGLPDFRNHFVQGVVAGRFLYIDIGAAAGQYIEWSRRLKIPLTGISWQTIDEVAANPSAILETHVPGTGKDGGPNCATVKPFGGWKVKVLSK